MGALRGSDGGPYTADDAWLDMDGPARSLILVVGAVDGVDAASRACTTPPAAQGRRVVAVFPTAAVRRQAAASASAARSQCSTMRPAPSRRPAASPWKAPASYVFAPLRAVAGPTPLVARFPAALDGVAGAVESALRDKGVLPAVRRTKRPGGVFASMARRAQARRGRTRRQRAVAPQASTGRAGGVARGVGV